MSNNMPELQYGCEFEFYVNQMIEDNLIDELTSVSKSELTVNYNNGQNDDTKMNYKRDASLTGTTGREITTPICSLDDLKEYILKISKIITSNAQTNEDTGFHIHISTMDKSLTLDFYRFMLLSNDKQLLTNWGSRNGFSLNVMDILDSLDMEEAKRFKNIKGRIWNLEKISDNHIEIRTMGGTNYQLKIEQILLELEIFIEIFYTSLKKPDKEYLNILKEHMIILSNCPKERKDEFLKVLNKRIV